MTTLDAWKLFYGLLYNLENRLGEVPDTENVEEVPCLVPVHASIELLNWNSLPDEPQQAIGLTEMRATLNLYLQIQ